MTQPLDRRWHATSARLRCSSARSVAGVGSVDHPCAESEGVNRIVPLHVGDEPGQHRVAHLVVGRDETASLELAHRRAVEQCRPHQRGAHLARLRREAVAEHPRRCCAAAGSGRPSRGAARRSRRSGPGPATASPGFKVDAVRHLGRHPVVAQQVDHRARVERRRLKVDQPADVDVSASAGPIVATSPTWPTTRRRA